MKKTNSEDFIRAWQSSNSIMEVVQKLGKSAVTIQSRASSFRKHGVPLKKFKSARRDWDKLIALAKSLSNKPGLQV